MARVKYYYQGRLVSRHVFICMQKLNDIFCKRFETCDDKQFQSNITIVGICGEKTTIYDPGTKKCRHATLVVEVKSCTFSE